MRWLSSVNGMLTSQHHLNVTKTLAYACIQTNLPAHWESQLKVQMVMLKQHFWNLSSDKTDTTPACYRQDHGAVAVPQSWKRLASWVSTWVHRSSQARRHYSFVFDCCSTETSCCLCGVLQLVWSLKNNNHHVIRSITWHHRSRDHSIPHRPLPFSGHLEPSLYL